MRNVQAAKWISPLKVVMLLRNTLVQPRKFTAEGCYVREPAKWVAAGRLEERRRRGNRVQACGAGEGLRAGIC
jgi:hypothetical protein